MNPHKKKLIAPVIITVLLVLFLLLYMAVCLLLPFSWWIKSAGLLFLAVLIGVCIYVLIQRIQEVRSGEEDDLSQY